MAIDIYVVVGLHNSVNDLLNGKCGTNYGKRLDGVK